MGILALHFYPAGSRINKNVIKPGTYKKGTAKLTPNASNMVNKLWVKGGKAISELYTQNITVGTEPILLNYSPREPVTVIIDGQIKTLGIQNIDQPGSHDFLLNASEKLLIPDLCTSGTGTISYCYEYPIKILLEDPESQKRHGIFEDKLEAQTNDKELAFELGLKHLFKYSEPVISGSIEPISGIYRAGELVKVEIPDLNINQYLRISEASYESHPLEPVSIRLVLETPERDLSNILKDMKQRLEKLEKETYQDDEGPILKYIAKEETYNWLEEGIKTEPIQSQEWAFWDEDMQKIEPIDIQAIEAQPTFSRSSVAYKSDGTQVAANQPRFEQGRFGKAIMVEEGTQNLLKNASFEVYTGTNGVADGWRSAYNSTVTTSYAVDTTTYRPSGVKSQKIAITASTGGGDAIIYQEFAIGAGVAITVSVYVQGSATGTGVTGLYLIAYDSAGAVISTFVDVNNYPVPASWTRIAYTATTPTGTAKVRVALRAKTIAAGDTATVYFDDVQVEQKGYPTSIIFANDTTTQATRSAETLTIPTAGVLNPQEGTIEFYHLFRSDSEPAPWLVGSSLADYTQFLAVVKSNASTLRFRTRNTSGVSTIEALVTDGWHYIAARWNSSEIALFIDGQKVGTVQNPYLPTQLASIIGIGYNHLDNRQYCNTLIDDLRISSRARTDEEIAAAYASGQPLPVDEWTTYKLDFDGKLQAQTNIKPHLVWDEDVANSTHLLLLPSESLYPSETLYP